MPVHAVAASRRRVLAAVVTCFAASALGAQAPASVVPLPLKVVDVDYIELLQVAPGNVGLIAGQPGDERTWGGTIKVSF